MAKLPEWLDPKRVEVVEKASARRPPEMLRVGAGDPPVTGAQVSPLLASLAPEEIDVRAPMRVGLEENGPPKHTAPPAVTAEALRRFGIKPAPPSSGASFLRGMAQGETMGFEDELLGAGRAAMQKVPALALLGGPSDVAGSLGALAKAAEDILKGDWRKALVSDANVGEVYRDERDKVREANAAAHEAHPYAYGGGNLAGGLVTAPLLPGGAGAGAPMSAMIKAGALQGLGMGALSGLGGSNADLVAATRGEDTAKNLREAAGDTALGAGVGAAFGAVAPPLIKYGGDAVKSGLRGLSDTLRKTSVDAGRRAIAGGVRPLSQTAKPLPDEVVERGFQEGLIKPLSTVEGTAGRFRAAADKATQFLNQIYDDLDRSGVRGFNVPEVQKAALAERAALLKSGGGVGAAEVPNAWGELASDPVGGIPAIRQAPAMLRANGKFTSKNPIGGTASLEDARGAVQNLQKVAKNEYAKVLGSHSLMGETKLDQASFLRQQLDDAVLKQRGLAPDEVDAFIPAKERVSQLVQGADAGFKAMSKAQRARSLDLAEELSVLDSKNPVAGLARALLMKEARQRGNSTAAWTARKASDMAGALAGSNVDPELARRLALAAVLSGARRTPKTGGDE